MSVKGPKEGSVVAVLEVVAVDSVVEVEEIELSEVSVLVVELEEVPAVTELVDELVDVVMGPVTGVVAVDVLLLEDGLEVKVELLVELEDDNGTEVKDEVDVDVVVRV
mmetsp:Transcript_27353/g.63801  ORF Transcript_27353/g.63801 Transcript_27353/m.63801 type:complete len:108 (-) Transcript_27353:613-936(-)